MSFPGTWSAIRAIFHQALLEDPMPSEMARKADLRVGTPSVGAPVSVMSESWIIEQSYYDSPFFRNPNDPRGILWETFPTDLSYWPTGDALYVVLCDLSGFTQIRNIIYVDPETPHPDFNVKVEASLGLDGASWADVSGASGGNWKFDGANVNLGGWPATIGEARGGAIASEWQDIASGFRSEVRLRWHFFLSEAEGVYDPATDWGVLRFGYADVQAR